MVVRYPVSSLTLHHLDPDAREAALTESFRVLKPEGRLHIADVQAQRLADMRETTASRWPNSGRGG